VQIDMTPSSELADIRTRLLDAAERLLAHYGYKKMTMDDLAAEAGVGRRTIYCHFKNKEELALATLDRTIDLLVAELRRLAEADVHPAERLRRMLVGRILFLFDREQNYFHSLDDMYAAIRSRYKAHREKYVLAEAEVFAEVIRDGQRRGALEGGDPVAVAHALVWATSTLTPFSLSPRELGAREVVAQRIQQIAGLLLLGIVRRGGESLPDLEQV
jgi:AcrR family transcriptional regulator